MASNHSIRAYAEKAGFEIAGKLHYVGRLWEYPEYIDEAGNRYLKMRRSCNIIKTDYTVIHIKADLVF